MEGELVDELGTKSLYNDMRAYSALGLDILLYRIEIRFNSLEISPLEGRPSIPEENDRN